MGKVFEEISAELQKWIQAQQMFFVASAPIAGDGLVNCSPKAWTPSASWDPTRLPIST